MSSNSVFETFKKEKQTVVVHSSKVVSIVFCLLFDEVGAYLEVRNDKGKVVEVDYQQYNGVVRTILKSLQEISLKAAFLIDWENPTNHIYLHLHDFLIDPLLQSGLWMDENGQKIEKASHKGFLKLHLEENATADSLQSLLKVWMNGVAYSTFRFLNDNHLFLEGKVVETLPLGKNYRALPLFNTFLQLGELPKFLSIFFSFTNNIELVYGDYSISRSEESVETKPVLIFEKLDADDALYMRVSQVLPGIDISLLRDYDLECFAAINEMEQLIEVKPIEQKSNEDAVLAIKKLLMKHATKKSEEEETEELVLQNDLFIIPQEMAAAFIYTDLPNLLTTYQIMGAENLKTYKVSTQQPKLALRLNHGINFLEGEASLHFNNEAFSLFDALQQYQKNKYILLSDGTHAFVNERYMEKLQRLFEKKADNVRVSFFDLPLVEELIDEKVAAQHLKHSKEVFEGFNDLHKDLSESLPVQATLRPYQMQGYKWLAYLHKIGLGGCLADDMGLGKTLQTISLLATIYPAETTPSLIVLPKSLLFNWEKELEKFAPQISYYTYYAGHRNMEEAMKSQIVLTTYSMMRIDIELFKEHEFYYVVLDESQNIKNLQSQTARAVMMLQSKHRLALSGTPIENNLGELYSLFRFLNPSMFGSFEHFNTHYLGPIQRNNDQNITADLRKKIYPFILRRLKKDVLAELPDKIEQVLYVEMSSEQKKIYEQRRQYYEEAIKQQIAIKGIQQSQFFVFQALSELRQLASTPEGITNGQIASPKIELLMEQLLDAIANKHKVLVFVNFLQALDLIGEKLDENGVEYVSMSGSTKNRQALVERFQNEVQCKVFLLTLKTGGTGLNLTAADMVFIFDPWWNKAAENQAIDRTHRIGQDKTVLSYKLITKDSIEEKILQLQEQKSEIFDNIISADSASLKSISTEDIEFMLGA